MPDSPVTAVIMMIDERLAEAISDARWGDVTRYAAALDVLHTLEAPQRTPRLVPVLKLPIYEDKPRSRPLPYAIARCFGCANQISAYGFEHDNIEVSDHPMRALDGLPGRFVRGMIKYTEWEHTDAPPTSQVHEHDAVPTAGTIRHLRSVE